MTLSNSPAVRSEQPADAIASILLFSPDGQWVSVAMLNGDVYLWKTAQAVSAQNRPFFHSKPFSSARSRFSSPFVSLSRRGHWIAIVDSDHSLFVLPKSSERSGATTPTSVGHISYDIDRYLGFSDDEKWLAWTKASEHSVLVRNLSTSQVIEALFPRDFQKYPTVIHERFIVRFSPDSRWLVGRGSFEPFFTWDLNCSSPIIGALSPGKKGNTRLDICLARLLGSGPNGGWVAGMANDSYLHFWQPSRPPGLLDKPVFLGKYTGDAQPSLAFSPDSTRAAAVAPDGSLYVFGSSGTRSISPVQLRAFMQERKFVSQKIVVTSMPQTAQTSTSAPLMRRLRTS